MRAAPILVALLLVSGVARANPGINGYSGKPYFGMAETCDTNCHKPPSTPVPTVTLTVPATVQAGSKNDVTLVIAGTRQRTSFDAAFTDGVVVTAGQNTNVPFPVETPDEITAVTPPPNGGTGTYKFSFTAPKTNGTITLYIAAMSASGAGTANDAVVKTTRTITVTGGTTPTSDAGASSSSSSTSSSSSSSGSTSGGTDDAGEKTSSGGWSGSSGSSESPRRLSNSGDGGGCAVARSGDASWLAVALALRAVARGRGRRTPSARGRS